MSSMEIFGTAAVFLAVLVYAIGHASIDAANAIDRLTATIKAMDDRMASDERHRAYLSGGKPPA